MLPLNDYLGLLLSPLVEGFQVDLVDYIFDGFLSQSGKLLPEALGEEDCML